MTELPYERTLREWVEARGMRHERLVYPRTEAGGETVAHRLVPDAPPLGLVLVVHGAGNDALFAFPGLFKDLLTRGYEVFSFDLDGHGRNSTTTFSYPAITGALAEALEHARGGRTDLPVHGFGLSLGGAVLLQSLPHALTGLASAVLVSAPLRIRLSLPNVLNEIRPALLGTALRQREHCGVWGMIPSFGPVKRRLYPLRLAEPREGAFGYVDALNDVLERMELTRAAGRTRIPTLLVYGTADRIVPAEQGLLLERSLAASELSLVKGGTHLTTVFHEQAQRQTLEWIERYTPASGRAAREA
ncbi:MAG: alpha/beta hydrolase [Gemmatimonadetes bacterium]|nr:alpha/beta hydrolase [Gemmatimonadota bacterium]